MDTLPAFRSWNHDYTQDMLSLEFMLKMIDALSVRILITHGDDVDELRDVVKNLFHTIEYEMFRDHVE